MNTTGFDLEDYCDVQTVMMQAMVRALLAIDDSYELNGDGGDGSVIGARTVPATFAARGAEFEQDTAHFWFHALPSTARMGDNSF